MFHRSFNQFEQLESRLCLSVTASLAGNGDGAAQDGADDGGGQ